MDKQNSTIPQPKTEAVPKTPAPQKQPGASSNTAPKLSQAEVAKGNPQAVPTQPQQIPVKEQKPKEPVQKAPAQQPQATPSAKTQKMIDSLKNKSYNELSGLQNQFNKIKGDMSPEEAKLVEQSLGDAISKEKELAMKRYLSIGKMLETNSSKLDPDTINKAKELLDSKSWTEGVSQKEFDNLVAAGTKNKESAKRADEALGLLENKKTNLPSAFKDYLRKEIEKSGGKIQGDYMDYINSKYNQWASTRPLTEKERILRLLFGDLYQPKGWYGPTKRR